MKKEKSDNEKKFFSKKHWYNYHSFIILLLYYVFSSFTVFPMTAIGHHSCAICQLDAGSNMSRSRFFGDYPLLLLIRALRTHFQTFALNQKCKYVKCVKS